MLRAGVELVLEEVKAAVDDWAPMRARATGIATELRRELPPVDAHELDEAEAFLEWLGEDHFTFLGYREYDLERGGDELTAIPGSGLGILRGASSTPSKPLEPKALALAAVSTSAGPDEGQLARDRPPALLPGLRRASSASPTTAR